MKYVLTKDGKIWTNKNPLHLPNYVYTSRYNPKEIIKEADTIEELVEYWASCPQNMTQLEITSTEAIDILTELLPYVDIVNDSSILIGNTIVRGSPETIEILKRLKK